MDNEKEKYIACKDCANCGYNKDGHYCKVINEPISSLLYYMARYCGDAESK